MNHGLASTPLFCGLALVMCSAASGCSDRSEIAPTGGPGDTPAVMLVGQAFTPEEYLSYVGVFPDVPQGNLDFSGFREFGNANAYTHGGAVFVEEDGEVQRFEVNDDL